MVAEGGGFRCLLKGRFAAAALATGRVAAVFQRSLYLESGAGALACLGPPGLGAGPLNALFDLPRGMDFDACGVRPGDAATASFGALRIGSLSFAAEGPLWRPPA